MNKNNSTLLVVSLFALVSSNSFAKFDPAVIKVGGIGVVPTVDVAESYDSNIFYSETDEKSALVTVIAPKVKAGMEVGANKYSVTADAAIGRYSSSSADNYVDSSIGMDIHQSFTRKAVLDVNASRNNYHEARGAGYSKGIASLLAEPDKYHINRLGAKFSYGSRDAIGRIVFGLSSSTRIYDTRRAFTKLRDNNNIGGTVTFYYHVMPKTSLLFELSNREIKYDNNPTYDSTEQRALVGVSWDISALTTGTAKAGLLEKNFDEASRKDFSGFSWELGARWTPLSYSVVDVVSKGRTEETNGSGDYIDSKSILTRWTHFWNEKVNTALDLNFTKNQYKPTSRVENYYSLGVQVTYNMRRWLNVGAGYTRSSNSSTAAGFDFDKNVFSLSLQASL